MQITMKVKDQARLNEWLEDAEKWPLLKELLRQADGWAKGMEILFIFCKNPALSLEDVERMDPFGTPKRFLIEVWEYGDELARQFERAQQEELKAQKFLKRNR